VTLDRFTADSSAALGGPSWLCERRSQAYERFARADMPSESEEVWRYSGIDRLDLGRFSPPDLSAPRPGPAEDLSLARGIADGLGSRSALVVTRDGVLVGIEASPLFEESGVRVFSSRSDWTDSQPPPRLGELSRPKDAFGEMHDAFMGDSIVLDVSSKTVLSDPVVIVHVVSLPPASSDAAGPATTGGTSCFPHLSVRVDTSAEAGVIEVFATEGSDAVHGEARAALVVPVTEISVGDDARLSYANLQVVGPSCIQMALQSSRIGDDGSLRSFTVSLGGAYARVRTDSDLAGQAAESALLAAYLGTDGQVHDFRTLQDHHGRRTRSELLFKGAVADEAHSVYSGLIRIARGAHGADAFQTNHNLVLSEGAHADSVPNLDIDENDVRCSHASTVGPIDEEQRYYLESRGVEPRVAERLIVLGFFSELASRSPFEGVGRFLERQVAQRLTGGPGG
jgi:Fe-S cluster assembly protein SufD